MKKLKLNLPRIRSNKLGTAQSGVSLKVQKARDENLEETQIPVEPKFPKKNDEGTLTAIMKNPKRQELLMK